MKGEANTQLFSEGHNLTPEENEMIAQPARRHTFVLVDQLPQGRTVVPSFRAGQSRNDGLLQFVTPALRHSIVTRSRCRNPLLRVISFCSRALQNEQVIRREISD